MSFKSNYFILYKHGMEDKIQWPEGWGNTCRGNIAPMLQEVLNNNAIGSELKLIWNLNHEMDVRRKHDLTHDQLHDYIKADIGCLHFQSKGTRKRAAKALERMGANDLVFVDNYRDVIVFQAHFRNHGEFPMKTEVSACG